MPSTDVVGDDAVRGGRGKTTRSGPDVDDPIARLEAIDVRSAEQEVYEALRLEITRGLAPGTPLRLAQVADRFKISTMPVRSALARLEAEGLVVQRPRRGAVVTDLTMDDFTDLYAIRMALEGVAARCGCVALSDDDLNLMRECYRGLTLLKLDGDDGIDQYLRLEWQLHDICYEAGRRPRLMRLVQTYRRQAERYFRLYLGARLDIEIDVANQAAFLHACEERNPERAEAAIRLLFGYTVDRLMPGLIEGTSVTLKARRP
jgi:DNA-binding GntR family transcriptional regulator